ncbi:DUF2982 domain-containing protein [Vibrio metoecus]|uniref:DUF2982 domain-containing protein n=1 Tax=Vibrio metoecus TaxID=1481663 RepID=UPI000BA984FF|nr:DUF2982 domain-containing protein [Vibrio metoecus]PAR37537.1 hypothetical protein CGT97_01820 [Vibrio metoecus]PAR42453.1 hypothetical protein CGT96_12010 [Vibrio metoecus]
MPTLQLYNHQLHFTPKILAGFALLASVFIIGVFWLAQTALQALVGILALFTWAALAYWLILKGQVAYTLTATHFQQHFYQGGWVVKWNNISQIGVCSYERDGWHQPLPWVGIRLKEYAPYLNSICPRLSTQVLLSQRALLYLGAQQQAKQDQFEDLVLDSTPYVDVQGNQYHGLQAMLANRMHHQREFFGYDLFISEQDLDRSAEEFVGLTRRYLAAAEPEYRFTAV